MADDLSAFEELTHSEVHMPNGGEPILTQALREEAEKLALAQAEAELQDLEDRARLPSGFSVSLLGWTEKCMHAAKLSKLHNHSGPEAHLGRLIHEVLATLDMMALTQGRHHISINEALMVADEVVKRSEEASRGPLSLQGYTDMMEMVSNWAVETTFPPNADLWEVELPVVTHFEGYRLTGRIDKVIITGTHCEIRDYKTGMWTPDQEEVMRTHSQLPLYAWHCHRKWPWLETFHLEEDYLRSGEVRPVSMEAFHVKRLEEFLAVNVQRVAKALAQDSPEATPGSHCAICPNSLLCPVPKEDRPESIASLEEAHERAAELVVFDQQRKVRSGSLQAYCKAEDHPDLLVVGDRKVGYHPTTENQFDKKGLAKALEAGEPATVEQFTTPVTKPKWGVRAVDGGRKGKRSD
jgi:hypothetical protein